MDGWVIRYGVPEGIHSDQGRNFASKVFQEMCKLLGIRKTRTTAYHPAGNGQGENWNRTLKSLLKAKVDGDVQRWDEHIGVCLMAYRSSVHQSTGYTPFNLMFGREMKLPLDIMIGVPNEEEYNLYGDFASKLKRKLTEAFKHVRENLQTAQCRQKDYYDRGIKDCSFQPGDQVFLYNPALKPGEAAKFHREWKGPYLVLQKVTEVTYKIRKLDEPRNVSKIVHFNNLKLYKRKETECDKTVTPEVLITPLSHNELVNKDVDEESEGDINKSKEMFSFKTTHNNPPQLTDEFKLESQQPNGESLSEGKQEERTLHTPDESNEDEGVEEIEMADAEVSQSNDEEGGGEETQTVDDDCGEERRPKRVRRPPNRYGDWLLSFIRCICQSKPSFDLLE